MALGLDTPDEAPAAAPRPPARSATIDGVSDDTPPAGIPIPAPGRYRHFKGNEYEVLSLARHSETLDWLVVYRRVNDPDSIWVRPIEMFLETVDRPEGPVQRFTPLT